MPNLNLLLPLLGIVWIDLLLSGDNAVVIALVCRTLPKKQQVIGIALGAGAAIVLRVIMAFAISWLLAIEGLRIAGGLFLLVIAAKLIWDEEGDGADRPPATSLWAAVGAIAIADASMSLDNVMAIAALSHGSIVLMATGVLISIPFVIVGAAVIKGLLDRFPWIVWLGAGLLGWVGGSIISDDPLLDRLLNGHETIAISTDTVLALAGLVVVLAVGAVHRMASGSKPAVA